MAFIIQITKNDKTYSVNYYRKSVGSDRKEMCSMMVTFVTDIDLREGRLLLRK